MKILKKERIKKMKIKLKEKDYWTCGKCGAINLIKYDCCYNCFSDANFRYENKKTRIELQKAIRRDLF